jgi:hypothetical protein
MMYYRNIKNNSRSEIFSVQSLDMSVIVLRERHRGHLGLTFSKPESYVENFLSNILDFLVILHVLREVIFSGKSLFIHQIHINTRYCVNMQIFFNFFCNGLVIR